MESFFNITLLTNSFFLGLVCFSFPRKWKLDQKGSIKAQNAQSFGILVSLISGIWMTFATLIFILILAGGERHLQMREHWFPLFLFAVGAEIYVIRILIRVNDKSVLEQSLLFMLNKYPSTEMTMEKMREFCKKNNMEYFPICTFRNYLSNLEKEECDDKTGKAFCLLVDNLARCRDYALLKKSVVSFDNFSTIKKEGGFTCL